MSKDYSGGRYEVHMNVRVYFHIPYNEKDDAKALGCRWDPEIKKWYCIDSDYGKSNISKCVKRWDVPEPYKIINGSKLLLSEIPAQDRGYTRNN